MGHVQGENLVVFYICLPREAVRQRREEVRNARGSIIKPATGNREHGRKDKEQASSSGPKVKEQTDVKSSKSQKTSLATRAKIPFLWRAKCKRSSCDYRHPPVCHTFKSGNRCIHGQRCLVRNADVRRNPVAVLRRKVQGCASRNSDPKKSILRKAGQVRLNASARHTIKFSHALGTKFEFGKENGNVEEFSKKVNIMSEILAHPGLRNEHLRKPQDKKIVPAKQHGTWRKENLSSKPMIKLLSLVE